MEKTNINLSVIIPVKDEENNIFRLGQEVTSALSSTDWSWECLWVDDGSVDASLSRLKELHQKDKRHKFIQLDQNYGQSAAMFIGFKQARGEILVTLDGDGQNDPNDIPRLVKFLLEHNAHMVNGWRKNRQDSLIRKLSSKIGNGFRNLITKDNIKDVGCSIRAFKRECVQDIFLFRGMHRFLPTLVRINGYAKILEVPVNHRPRQFGQTKYGISNRLWVGLMDTLAVLWMRIRSVNPKIKTSSLD
jgi:glycosyltransferase involved in cell wall biosynthesis